MICKLGSHIDTMVYQMSHVGLFSLVTKGAAFTYNCLSSSTSIVASYFITLLLSVTLIWINKQQTWDTDTAQEIQQSCRRWYSNDCIHSDTVTFWTTYKFRKSIILSVICFRTTIIFMCPNTAKVNMCLIILHVWIHTVAMVFINSANRNVLYLSLFVWCLGS